LFGAPPQISTGFASCLRHCCDIAHWRPTTLCTTFGRILRCYTIYFFRGCCPLTEFCRVQNSLYVQVLRSLILPALLHGTPEAAGVSQTLRRDTRNGIIMTALWNGTGHYIFILWFLYVYLLSSFFPRLISPAITLGIGPHSSKHCRNGRSLKTKL